MSGEAEGDSAGEGVDLKWDCDAAAAAAAVETVGLGTLNRVGYMACCWSSWSCCCWMMAETKGLLPGKYEALAAMAERWEKKGLMASCWLGWAWRVWA